MQGFFYMAMGPDNTNLAIERDCVAGTPTYTKPNAAKKTAEEIFTQ